jgi:hypothetical protein
LITHCNCGEPTPCEHVFRDRAAIAIAAHVLGSCSGHFSNANVDQQLLQTIARNSMRAAVELSKARDLVDYPPEAPPGV